MPRPFDELPPRILLAFYRWHREQIELRHPQISEHFDAAAFPLLDQWERGDIDEATAASLIRAIEADARPRLSTPKVPHYHLRNVFSALRVELTARGWKKKGRGPGAYSGPERACTYVTEWWYRRWAADPLVHDEPYPYFWPAGPPPRGGPACPNEEVAARVKVGKSPRALALFLVAERYGVSADLVRKSLLRRT